MFETNMAYLVESEFYSRIPFAKLGPEAGSETL
jgi:hypothetical protein